VMTHPSPGFVDIPDKWNPKSEPLITRTDKIRAVPSEFFDFFDPTAEQQIVILVDAIDGTLP